MPRRHDSICEDIAQCATAGSFGKFLRAVTGECRAKSFDGYFGLDGLTFGILDYTSDKLPALFEIYQQSSPEAFNQTFGSLNLPMTDKCLDPQWVCNQNRAANLVCDSKFHDAFERSVSDPYLQKGQLKLALEMYHSRIKRFQSLGLRTEYGIVALAVVANNLRKDRACQPPTWKKQCQGRGDESAVVDCMMQKYVQGVCRHSARGTQGRANQIAQLFQDHKKDV
jgi:hypothetical protein